MGCYNCYMFFNYICKSPFITYNSEIVSQYDVSACVSKHRSEFCIVAVQHVSYVQGVIVSIKMAEAWSVKTQDPIMFSELKSVSMVFNIDAYFLRYCLFVRNTVIVHYTLLCYLLAEK